MKYESFHIENFKGIKSIDVDLTNNRILTLVGLNESGKTTILQADWFSGSEHFGGFLIAGFNYKVNKSTTLYAGYQIPNSSKVGVSGFCLELAKIF